MIDLAVASRAETFERMRGPLADRDVRARYVRPKERTFDVAGFGAGEDGEFDGFDVGYVYPSRLMEGGVVDARLDVPWVNDRGAVLTSRNKAGVLARLDAAGIPVPRSVLVSNPVEESAVVDAFERFEPPVVVKPNSGTRGLGTAKVHDVDSLLGVLDYVSAIHGFEPTGDRSFLLQSYLPDARDYRLMVLDGEYVGAVERRLPDEAVAAGRWKHNVHRSAVASRADPPGAHRRLAEQVADVLGIDLLGVDLLVAGGDPYVTETNARPTIDDAAKYEPDFYDRLAGLVRSRAA